jgi:hypothetical protein
VDALGELKKDWKMWPRSLVHVAETKVQADASIFISFCGKGQADASNKSIGRLI